MTTLNLPYIPTHDHNLDLNLFVKNNDDNPKCLKKIFSVLNDMIELNYITMEGSGLHITNSGLNYIQRHGSKFLENIDFCQMSCNINKSGEGKSLDNCKRFYIMNNTLDSYENSSVDYNKIKFAKKAVGQEPMG